MGSYKLNLTCFYKDCIVIPGKILKLSVICKIKRAASKKLPIFFILCLPHFENNWDEKCSGAAKFSINWVPEGISQIHQVTLTKDPVRSLQRGFKETKTRIAIFGPSGINGFQPKFLQLDIFYRQPAMKTLLVETQPQSYGKKWILLCLKNMTYNVFPLSTHKEIVMRQKFPINYLIQLKTVDLVFYGKHQAGSFG